ncbi:MAG TPA: DUF885 domain-containing protein [Methylomirabilota bacterium]|nr:DUF885 domain-containing protein [Methylomirabilota bacterium]
MKTRLLLTGGTVLVLATTFLPHVRAASLDLTNALDASLSPMRGLIERHQTDLGALERDHTVPTAASRTERLRRFYEEQLARVDAVDFDALDADDRVDHILFRHKLRHELRGLEHEQKRLAEMAELIPFADAVVNLEQTRRRMEPVNSPQAARVLAELVRQLESTRKKLEKSLDDKEARAGLPQKAVAHRAASTTDRLRQTLKRWNDFYAGYDPEFTWWTSQPYQKADKALEDYAGFLRKKLAGLAGEDDDPIIGDPIGREALLDALAYEMIPYTPEELIRIAEKEFAWCEAEYRRAARDLGFGDDWRKALDHVSNLHVKPGEQPALIKKLADEAVAFLEQRDLVTIPALCQETWRMEMMTPERQRVNPFFTGGEVISVSFPTATMSHEDKLMSMRGNNIHFSRATVHHELIPGHHLQLFMAQRHNTHRRLFRTPFIVEGWPLYWEMLLWDLGFAQSPEDRVGMLFWRSHRCARIIFSLKFHLGQMTPQEAIDFLVERVGHERRNATGEVRRSFGGSYEPLYQAAYMLGGLQLRALRRELVDTGRMTNRDFHDAILRQNAIPVEMIRARLGGHPLPRDFRSSWRFYDLEQQ